eukprot:1940089-Rhodomonas_salina.1
MEAIFTEEALHKHPLKAMRVWKCMSNSVFKILPKDSCDYLSNLQTHARYIDAWELDYLDAYLKRMEVLPQDLLRSGHTEDIADDCIVCNLLKVILAIPLEAPHGDDWKFAARTW